MISSHLYLFSKKKSVFVFDLNLNIFQKLRYRVALPRSSRRTDVTNVFNLDAGRCSVMCVNKSKAVNYF